MLQQCPYKGLAPYRESDAPYFFGRDRERRLISAALRASRLTVLYGESGAGKSSLLAAGVAHDLRDDPEYAVVLFRNWLDEPVAGILAAAREVLSKLPGFAPDSGGGKPDHLHALLRAWAESTRRCLLVVFDQFEEYFQYHPREHGPGKLPDELPRLLNQPDIPVNFLISVREDGLGALDCFKGAIPNLFDNLLRVEHLSRESAQDAIMRPLKKFNQDHLYPVQIEKRVAAQVVSEIVLAQGEGQERVQAPYLQLVMTRWWEREAEAGSQILRSETLRELGGVEG